MKNLVLLFVLLLILSCSESQTATDTDQIDTSSIVVDTTDDERQHIEKLAKFMDLHQDWFDEACPTNAQKINDEITLFAYSWIDYAKEGLGWDDQMIHEIAGTPTRMINLETVKRDYGTYGGSIGGRPDCRCRTGWAGCAGTCIAGKNNCKDDGLKGCGLLWLQSCNGMCGV